MLYALHKVYRNVEGEPVAHEHGEAREVRLKPEVWRRPIVSIFRYLYLTPQNYLFILQ